MQLTFETYKDKVLGAWAGKNIGGVLGEPYECLRQFNEIDFYQQDLSNGPPPNDDLDLQIVWLAAVERYGRNVNASILGEYWLSFVIPNWVEYGMGKANLRAGLEPPMSGYTDNPYKNSCGCFIRSELWACLAPGLPALAAKYAYEDAIVDHAEEGMYAEVFCAALQSAAFVESDVPKLLDIALSYVPKDSKLASAINAAISAKKDGLTLKDAIVRIHEAAPGTFGVQGLTAKEAEAKTRAMGMETVGEPGFDAPENVGYAIAGLLYGRDFGEKILFANACGEDTDCTCATLGAMLGILMGASGLPEKWTKPLNDKIATKCIDMTSGGVWVPKTVTELSDRVLRLTPLFLGREKCDLLAEGGYAIMCDEGEALYCPDENPYAKGMNGGGKDHTPTALTLSTCPPRIIRRSFPAFSAAVDLKADVFFDGNGTRQVSITVKNSLTQCQQQWARIALYTPDDVIVIGGAERMLPLNNVWGAEAHAEFELDLSIFTGAKLELIFDVQLEGRHSNGQIKAVLMRR